MIDWDNPKIKDSLLIAVSEFIDRERKRFDRVVSRHYPDHIGHGGIVEAYEEQYLDALFIGMKLRCKCGAGLLMTREMSDE